MSYKRTRSAFSPEEGPYYRSSAIEDRSSRFVAIFSPTLSALALQARPEFQSASHRIAAWRKPGAQRTLTSQGVFETGWDDDGETYGGKTLEKVLVARNVFGAVVVARWYGGVMLGPVRFDHMRDCAGEAIALWEQASVQASKRIKPETDTREEREQLVRVLPERDESIKVLRALLAEKKNALSSKATTGEQGGLSSSRAVDYSTMDVRTLLRLEQVRDKTIGWLLDQIEKAEAAEVRKSDAGEIASQGNDGTIDIASQTPSQPRQLSVESQKDDFDMH